MFVPQKELSQEQAYWLSANEIASNASNPATPVTPFVHNRPPPSQVLFHLQKVNAVFHQFEGIINERTTQKPLYVSEWCFDYAKQFVEQQLVPFYDHFKKHIESANETIFKEVKEYEQIFDDLDAEYERCVLDNKNLTIEKKNLLIKNDCLIAECLEKDICSIVLTSDIVVPPSSNCLCEDLRSACDREHTKVLELEAEVLKQQKMVIESEKRNSHLQKTHIDLQLKFQNYKQCIDTSSASNAIFEINKLRKQLQGKDDTIRNLDAQINIMKVLNVGSTEGSCDQQALETDRIQLKDTITSLRIQLDGLKVENVSLKRRYDELSKANTHSRTAYTEKLSALTTQHTKLQAQVTGKTSSGPSTSETPKVLAPGMYNLGSKYIPPPKRANWVKPTPLPKKKQVTFLFVEPPRPSSNQLKNSCSRHMTGDRARLINFVEKFIGTVRFGNDEYAAIVGYVTVCDGGLEVAFRQHSCYIRNSDMVDLLKGSRTTNLYSISLNDMMSASPMTMRRGKTQGKADYRDVMITRTITYSGFAQFLDIDAVLALRGQFRKKKPQREKVPPSPSGTRAEYIAYQDVVHKSSGCLFNDSRSSTFDIRQPLIYEEHVERKVDELYFVETIITQLATFIVLYRAFTVTKELLCNYTPTAWMLKTNVTRDSERNSRMTKHSFVHVRESDSYGMLRKEDCTYVHLSIRYPNIAHAGLRICAH
ncbi:hypothetical protein Tco_0431621 [Tanacetum coccineum]